MPTLTERKKMRRIVITVLGLIGVLVGLGFILPALAQVRDHGAMPDRVVGIYTLGVSLAVVGASTMLYGITRRKA
jgi:hypothetical protein